MTGIVFRGQLIYVDTEKGEIQILNKDSSQKEFTIDSNIKWRDSDWENLLGQIVDVIVIDDKVKRIYVIDDEENDE
jgi:hypothetical protein